MILAECIHPEIYLFVLRSPVEKTSTAGYIEFLESFQKRIKSRENKFQFHPNIVVAKTIKFLQMEISFPFVGIEVLLEWNELGC